jgi:uncharacterized protein
VTETVLVDTGPLVALFSARDRHHHLCTKTLKNLFTPLYTCWPVLIETAYLLRSYPARQRDLFHSFERGLLALMPLETSEFSGLADLMDQYADLKPQLADVALEYLARREHVHTIFTLDRRDFTVYRNQSGDPFTLLASDELL